MLDLTKKTFAKNVDFKEPIVYWHWVNDNVMGVVGNEYVYHIDLAQAESTATTVFARYKTSERSDV